MPDQEGFKIASAWVGVEPDTDGFREKLEAAIQEAVDGVEGKVKIGADDEELQKKAAAAKAKVDELDGTEAKATLTADDEDLSAKTDKSKADLGEIDGTEAKATLTADDEDLTEKTDSAKEKLGQLDGAEASPKLGLDKGDFDARKDEADAQLDENDARKASPKLGLDDGEFKTRLAEDESALSAAGGGSGGSGGFGSGLLKWGGIAAGISSLLPGIGGAATGLGALGGTGMLAFGGIAKALEASHQASQNVGQTSATLAATEFQNSVQIQQAQAAIGQAHRQAAEDAVTSAQAISSAEANLTEVERNASASQVQAVQAVGQAQQQLQQANFGLAQAQYNLSMAWIQARFNLEQLNDAERNSATTIAAAKLAVAQAQREQTLTDQNAFSTSLDREQVAIAVQQAEEALTSAQQQATETAAEAHLEDKKGVAGSQTVVSAQEAVTEAVNGVRNAQQQLADAQRNLVNTELNNAAQVKQAQLAVVQAQQQAAYQQENDAIAVEQAQKNLTDTLREQQLQQKATASTANQAANQFAKDMERLSPAGREMVRMILSISSAFGGMERIAQKAVAPGMVQFLRGIKDLLPGITFGVKLMGDSISRAFGQFGKEMQTKAFSDIFRSLLVQGNQFVNTVLPAFAQFIQELARVGAEKGAVTGLAELLAGLGRGLTAVVRAMGPFAGSLSSVLSTLGSALRPIGTLLGDVVGGIARALAPGLKALLPGFTKFVDLLGSSLASALSSLGPGLGIVGGALGGILAALSPLLPVLGQFIGAMAQALTPALTAVAGALTPLAATLARALTPVIQSLTPILGSMGGMLGHIAVSLADVLIAVLPLIPPLANLTVGIIDMLAPLIKLGDFLGGLMLDALDGVVKGVGVVIKVIGDWITTVTDWQKSWQEFASQLGTIWHQMTSAWDATGQGIKQVAGDLWQYLWGDFGAKIESFFVNTIPGWWRTFWSDTKSIFAQGVSGLGTIWHGIEKVFSAPVDFLVNVVYDKGIAWLWNEVVSHIGLGSLKLPTAHLGLARGGITPGTDHGRDEYLLPMRPGEGVLTPKTVAGIGGPAAVYALNNYHDSASSKLGGLAHGGVVGNIGNFLGHVGHDIVSGAEHAYDIARLGAAVISGNTTAFANALDAFTGRSGGATGDLAKVITQLPRTLVADAAKVAVKDARSLVGAAGSGMGTGSQGGLGGSAKGTQVVQFGESFIGRVPYVFGGTSLSSGVDCSGFTMDVYDHFGFRPPRTSEEQWTWVQRTPQPVLGGLAFFAGSPIDPPPGHVGIITGSNQMVDAYGTGFGVRLNSIYGSSGAVFGFGVPPGGGLTGEKFDQGGLMMGPPNYTGQPERVLSPQQTDAFDRLVDWLTTHGSAGPANPGATVTQNFYGTQLGPEQRAEIRREMGMALSGP